MSSRGRHAFIIEQHSPGWPNFKAGGRCVGAATAFEIFAPPLWPISIIGGTSFRATDVSTEVVLLIGICLLEDMALTTPPPTTAPTAKHAAWMTAELGIFHPRS